MSELITRIAGRLRHAYSGEGEPSSMGGHAAALAAFAGYTAAWTAAVRSRGSRFPSGRSPGTWR